MISTLDYRETSLHIASSDWMLRSAASVGRCNCSVISCVDAAAAAIDGIWLARRSQCRSKVSLRLASSGTECTIDCTADCCCGGCCCASCSGSDCCCCWRDDDDDGCCCCCGGGCSCDGCCGVSTNVSSSFRSILRTFGLLLGICFVGWGCFW